MLNTYKCSTVESAKPFNIKIYIMVLWPTQNFWLLIRIKSGVIRGGGGITTKVWAFLKTGYSTFMVLWPTQGSLRYPKQLFFRPGGLLKGQKMSKCWNFSTCLNFLRVKTYWPLIWSSAQCIFPLHAVHFINNNIWSGVLPKNTFNCKKCWTLTSV